jgi:putative hydrolase of the HAD superfamily
MTEELDAIMLDAGGTLWDMKPSVSELFLRMLKESGSRVSKERLRESIRKADRHFDEDFAQLDGVHEEDFWKKYDRFVLKDLDLEIKPDVFSKKLSSEYRHVVSKVESWVEYSDAHPFLRDLRKRDMKVGLVSNATDLARRVLKNLEMDKYFDFVVLSAEVGARKPNKRIFTIAAKEAGASPSRCLFLGDKLAVDVKGASNAGMNAVLVDRENVYPDAGCIRVRNLRSVARFL